MTSPSPEPIPPPTVRPAMVRPAMVQPSIPVEPSSAGFGRALRACAVWAVFDLFMMLALFGPPPSAAAAVRTVGALVAAVLAGALLVWPLLVSPQWRRGRAERPFWQVLLVALPAFLLIQLVTALVTG